MDKFLTVCMRKAVDIVIFEIALKCEWFGNANDGVGHENADSLLIGRIL